jgi:hypothetical protein
LSTAGYAVCGEWGQPAIVCFRGGIVQKIAFHQLPLWVRIAAALTVFNTWVLIAEFVIDRYGLDDYLPFYRYGDVCLWDIPVIIALVAAFVRASRDPAARVTTTPDSAVGTAESRS